ncbi:MAG: YlxR family protein [Tenericutes bacterium]|nr:YlxR family protein [Mycoplasmatota bacterium]
MKVKKIPQRTCVVTQEKYDKKDLIRVVKTPLNEVVIDLSGKINGRGAYLKKDLEVIEKARKSKALERHLEIEIKDEVYDKLKEIIK